MSQAWTQWGFPRSSSPAATQVVRSSLQTSWRPQRSQVRSRGGCTSAMSGERDRRSSIFADLRSNGPADESESVPRRRALLAAAGSAIVAGCLDGGDETPAASLPLTGTPVGSIGVTSTAFGAGEAIPARHTADGVDVSPPLSLQDLPAEAAALAVLVDDPDAPDPPFTHWLCWAIPPDTASITAGRPRQQRLPSLGGAVQGRNDMGDLGYRGPAPPADDGPHRYRFRIVAHAAELDLSPGATRESVDQALSDAVLDRGRLVGTDDR